EDGIRDFHVTGVQTCALPISHMRSPFTRCFAAAALAVAVAAPVGAQAPGAAAGSPGKGGVPAAGNEAAAGLPLEPARWARFTTRSEERRVGQRGARRRTPHEL